MRELSIEKLLRDSTSYLHSDCVKRTLFLKATNRMYV